MTRLVNLRIEEDLLARIDEAAGPRQRSAWMVRAFEAALDGSAQSAPEKGSAARGVGAEKAPCSPSAVPAAPRASIPTQVAGAQIVRARSLVRDVSQVRPIPRQS